MTPIYRMVHIDNLPLLLEWGGDYASNRCRERGLAKRPIHHENIMERRKDRDVSCGPGGTLADYVPFYFRVRTPMLYSIYRGNVEGCQNEREIVILRSYVETIAEAGLGFVFTNGHAVIAYTQIFDDLNALPSLPWDAIRGKYWNDYEDGRCDCQSEFLVRDFFPLSLVDQIGVFDEDARAHCAALTGCPSVAVERAWYF